MSYLHFQLLKVEKKLPIQESERYYMEFNLTFCLVFIRNELHY